jgi:UDP-glucose 4-epimerase
MKIQPHIIILTSFVGHALQVPVNPYGRSKKLAEEIIKDYSDSNPQFSAAILRWCQISIAFTFLC